MQNQTTGKFLQGYGGIPYIEIHKALLNGLEVTVRPPTLRLRSHGMAPITGIFRAFPVTTSALPIMLSVYVLPSQYVSAEYEN
jgi:hypothetical protein